MPTIEIEKLNTSRQESHYAFHSQYRMKMSYLESSRPYIIRQSLNKCINGKQRQK